MNTHLSMLTIDIHSEGRNKTIIHIIEHTQETLMERQAGTQDGGKHHAVAKHVALLHAKRRLNAHGVVLQLLGYLISHDLAQTLDVGAEAQALLLQLIVTDFAHELSH